jgi:triacylglycerol lipase
MAALKEAAAPKRFHVVLVPGFGGFDALGKVEYYAGVTRLFHAWKAEEPVVLHYFDNYPTAAVVTRAARLCSYLAKRIVRGEILKGDDLILVGHSTGGLDIRQLVSALHDPANDPVHADGGVPVSAGDILDCLRRVVFLSVPHWGTNIADWVRSHPIYRKAVIAEMEAAFAGSQFYLLDEIEERIAGGAARLTGAEVLLAVQDTLTEANERFGDPGPLRTAEALEAASEVELYLRHMASDFHVIDDLASQPAVVGPRSPAQFNEAERRREWKRWERIEVLSYATIADCPFRFEPGSSAPVWDLGNLSTYPEIAKDAQRSSGTDLAYRVCYRACAGGPFRHPASGGKVTRRLGEAPPRPIELWDNDGIVNTLSMLWPQGDNVLVPGDHLDIVGHYHLTEARPAGGRRYRSYDPLKSVPQFSDWMFAEVWSGIFDFAISKPGRTAAREAAFVGCTG